MSVTTGATLYLIFGALLGVPVFLNRRRGGEEDAATLMLVTICLWPLVLFLALLGFGSSSE